MVFNQEFQVTNWNKPSIEREPNHRINIQNAQFEDLLMSLGSEPIPNSDNLKIISRFIIEYIERDNDTPREMNYILTALLDSNIDSIGLARVAIARITLELQRFSEYLANVESEEEQQYLGLKNQELEIVKNALEEFINRELRSGSEA